MTVIRGANATLSFLLELAMLGAVVFWGFATHRGWPIKIITGVGLPIVLIAFWGFLMAPTAAHRLPWPWVPIVAVVLFLAADALLWHSRHPVIAAVLAGLAVLNAVLTFAFGQR